MDYNGRIISEIQSLTRGWSLSDWKDFRTNYDYWETKDRYDKQWYNRKRGIWNNGVYTNWLKWKLEIIKEYVLDNQ